MRHPGGGFNDTLAVCVSSGQRANTQATPDAWLDAAALSVRPGDAAITEQIIEPICFKPNQLRSLGWTERLICLFDCHRRIR